MRPTRTNRFSRLLRARAGARSTLALAQAIWLLGCAAPAGVSPTPVEPELSEAERTFYTRRLLEDGRTFLSRGQLTAAERASSGGLELAPDHPGLLQLHAEVLAAQGLTEEARIQQSAADAAGARPPPLPRQPHELDAEGTVVFARVSAASEAEAIAAAGSGSGFESGSGPDAIPSPTPSADFLVAQIERRLPRATVVRSDRLDPLHLESVASIRGWLRSIDAERVLSVHVDRAYCGQSLKDGRFAVAQVRMMSAAATAPAAARVQVKDVRTAQAASDACATHAAARAFERALASPEIIEALAEPPTLRAMWRREPIRVLFPSLGERIDLLLHEARARSASGQLNRALESYRAALAIDPGDVDALTLARDAERSLALSLQVGALPSAPLAASPDDPTRTTRTSRANAGTAELGQEPRGSDTPSNASGGFPGVAVQRRDEPGPRIGELADGDLDPNFNDAQRRALEDQLAREQRRREQMLAVLELLDTDITPPTPDTIAAMKTLQLDDLVGRGIALSRERHTGPLDARALYAPDGSLMARYFFANERDTRAQPPSNALLLREEDSRGDGIPDRWVAFLDGSRSEIWEVGEDVDAPHLHLIYAQGGEELEAVEIDSNRDGGADRVFRYGDGRVLSEARDTNGDRGFDVFEYFDESGGLLVREEDRDHDGHIDVRTLYREGRMIRRELLSPDLVQNTSRTGIATP